MRRASSDGRKRNAGVWWMVNKNTTLGPTLLLAVEKLTHLEGDDFTNLILVLQIGSSDKNMLQTIIYTLEMVQKNEQRKLI